MSGHSHRFAMDDDSVSIPCTACTKQYDSEIGFILLEEEEKELVIKQYNKDSNQTEEYVMKKKYVRC